MSFPTPPFLRKRREGGAVRLAGVQWDSYTYTEMSSEMLVTSTVRLFYTIHFPRHTAYCNYWLVEGLIIKSEKVGKRCKNN